MIKIENLTKKINDKIIFNNLNLEIPPKKITFVIGKSGIGKTTLINLIAGFMKKDSGKITFFDQKGTEIKDPLIDVVFQDFNLINNISSKNNILIGNNIINRIFDQKDLEKKANYISIKNQQLNQAVNSLSGGEKQRIAILRSLSRDCDFILLDEPTGNLDFENGDYVFKNLENIAKNKTILVVSHNLEFARKYADKIVYIEKEGIRQENFEKTEQNSVANTEKDGNSVVLNNSPNSKISKIKQELKTAFLLTVVDYKSKFFSTILFAILFLASFFGTLLFGTLNLNISTANYLKVSEYQLDSVVIAKKTENEFSNGFTENEISKIKDKNKTINKIAPFFTLPFLNFEYNSKKEFAIPIDYIDETAFFKNRFNFDGKILVGRPIKNEDEIIISKTLATKLNIQEPKEQKISVFSGNKIIKTVKVVGINSSVTSKKLNLTFLHYKLGENIGLELKNKTKIDNSETAQVKKIQPLLLKLYFKHENLVKNIENFTKNNSEYRADSPLVSISKLTIDVQNLVVIIAGVILITFIAILLIQIIFYSKNLSDSKIKLIGILKALRAKTWHIFLYHWLNIIIISVLILVINLSIFLPLMPKIYSAIVGQEAFLPPISQIAGIIFVIWIVMFFVISTVYLLISWFNYKKPVTKLLKFDQN